MRGYFPALATIANTLFYIEDRNGNYNLKTEQLATCKIALAAKSEQGEKPKFTQMDCGLQIKELTDYFHKQNILLLIRVSNSETLLIFAADFYK